MDKSFANASTRLNPARIDTKGSSPVILAVPHRGFEVPEHFRDHNGDLLGLSSNWFAIAHPELRRHEVSDWGIGTVASIVYNNNQSLTMISTDISRLVVDVDRVRREAVIENSEDTGELIPSNTRLSLEPKEVRLRAYYDPYHNALDEAVAKAKSEHGGAVVIHAHAFSKKYRQAERHLNIGTIYPEQHNPLADAVSKSLYQHEGVNFAPHYPYDLRERDVNVMRTLADRQGVWHVGIEINQEVLLTPKGISTMSALLTRVIDDVRTAPNFTNLLVNRNIHRAPQAQPQPNSIVLPLAERVM